MAEFIDKILDKHRSSFTPKKAREFADKLVSDMSVKAMTGAASDDPDIVRIIGSVVCIRLLLEQSDSAYGIKGDRK